MDERWDCNDPTAQLADASETRVARDGPADCPSMVAQTTLTAHWGRLMGLVELLGWSGSVLVVLSLTQSNLRRLRLVNLAASVLHLGFNLIIGIVPMIALNLVLTGINFYYLVRDKPGPNGRKGQMRVRVREETRGRYQAALPMVRSFEKRVSLL
jgi:hypothetical protein